MKPLGVQPIPVLSCHRPHHTRVPASNDLTLAGGQRLLKRVQESLRRRPVIDPWQRYTGERVSSRWWAMPLESPAVISSKHCWRSSRKRRGRAGKPKAERQLRSEARLRLVIPQAHPGAPQPRGHLNTPQLHRPPCPQTHIFHPQRTPCPTSY